MDLDMLNRLRVNAGKPELKSWKASKALLAAAIKGFQEKGFTDALPGANLNATPQAADPALLEPFKEPEKNKDVPEEKVTKVKTQLARGIETEGYAKHSRKAVQDIRREERKTEKASRKATKDKIKLSEKDKKQIKDEAEDRTRGKVDAKKDPEKAKRQQDKIQAKRDKREKEGKKPKPEKISDEITVAEIARELDIDPRVARAKLRRHEDKIKSLHTKGQDRWTFPKSAKKEIKAILEGKK